MRAGAGGRGGFCLGEARGGRDGSAVDSADTGRRMAPASSSSAERGREATRRIPGGAAAPGPRPNGLALRNHPPASRPLGSEEAQILFPPNHPIWRLPGPAPPPRSHSNGPRPHPAHTETTEKKNLVGSGEGAQNRSKMAAFPTPSDLFSHFIIPNLALLSVLSN